MNKELYNKEIRRVEAQIKLVERLNDVNSNLQSKNWVFLHPYSQGGDISVLEKIFSRSKNPDEEVIIFFARKFFDLRSTIHFVEGFYNERPFLKDYVSVIREAVVLCLQKDFYGAISILIPVIEGTLRKLLVHKKGEHKKNEIDIKELLKVFNILTNDYVELQIKYLGLRNKSLIESNKYLDVNQENQIRKKHKYHFELWINQLKKFIENSLYLGTKTNVVTDNFNRYLIFHGLEDNIEFSFSNFLRIFNSLNFLSWAISSTTEGCSILSTASEQEVKNKWADYLNILIASEATTEYKNNIYSQSVKSFKDYLHPKQDLAITRAVIEMKKILKLNDFLKS